MASFEIISQKLTERFRYREAVRELSAMTDHELSDAKVSGQSETALDETQTATLETQFAVEKFLF